MHVLHNIPSSFYGPWYHYLIFILQYIFEDQKSSKRCYIIIHLVKIKKCFSILQNQKKKDNRIETKMQLTFEKRQWFQNKKLCHTWSVMSCIDETQEPYIWVLLSQFFLFQRYGIITSVYKLFLKQTIYGCGQK